MSATEDKLRKLRADIAEHLEEIAALFTQRPKITIVIRTGWLNDGDVVLTDDEADLAIEALRKLEKNPGHVFPADVRP
jgi:hypothetical protein